jgi:hypothetical protein
LDLTLEAFLATTVFVTPVVGEDGLVPIATFIAMMINALEIVGRWMPVMIRGQVDEEGGGSHSSLRHKNAR